MTKNEMKNLGFPLSVDVKRDMPAIGKGVFDSWYVISNFEADGQNLPLNGTSRSSSWVFSDGSWLRNL